MNDVENYINIRNIGMELNNNMLDSLNNSDVRIAARTLGLLKNNRIRINEEGESDRFSDFILNDFFDTNGKNAVERYFDQNIEKLDVVQTSILYALLAASSSLFEVVEINENKSTIKLSDLISKNESVTLVDIGFSQSPNFVGFLVYTRVIRIGNISMTSGTPMLFEKKYRDHLLENYRKIMKTISLGGEKTKKSVAFRKLFKKIGFQQVAYI